MGFIKRYSIKLFIRGSSHKEHLQMRRITALFPAKHAENSLIFICTSFNGKLNTSKWAKITTCSQDTALRDIQNMIDQDILIKETPGGRSTGYTLKSI